MGRKVYGFGIVGCGMIARFHAHAVLGIRNARLVSAVDNVPAAAKSFGKEFGIKTYTSIRKFIAHPGIDVVAIATPSGFHLEPTLAAAAARKHVICEKPLEVTIERCDRMIRECRKRRVMLAGIFPSRTHGSIQAVKKALDGGRFGRMTLGEAHVRWWRTQAYYDSGAWRGTWKLDGGGALMNQSIHTIDLLQWLGGPISHITAFADRLAHKRIEVEDTAVACLRFKNGALGSIIGTTCAPPGYPTSLFIAGDKGSVIWRDGRIAVWEPGKKLASDKKLLERYGPKPIKGRGRGAADAKAIDVEPHRKQFLDMLNALDSHRSPMVDGPEARKAVEIIQAVYKSAQTGKTVKLPLKKSPRVADMHSAARKRWKA